VNPYRGCEHGCIYCYARPSHEWLGFSAGLDFESKIIIKPNAAELLKKELGRRSWRREPICLSGNTDCYQPVERVTQLTRECLKVLLEARNPVLLITKNALVMRDVDILHELAELKLVTATISLTTLDPKVARLMEPRASAPAKRLEAVRCLADAGVPVGVNIGPVIPGLTDEEIPAILAAARDFGANRAGHSIVRLPGAVEPLFVAWLEQHFPLRAAKILSRLRGMHGGELNDSQPGRRHRGDGEHARVIHALFERLCRHHGLSTAWTAMDPNVVAPPLVPKPTQGDLFGVD